MRPQPAEVGVQEHLLTQGIVDDCLVDTLSTFDVELSDSGVGVESDVCVFGVVDAHKGHNGNPAGIVAGKSVVVDGCLE